MRKSTMRLLSAAALLVLAGQIAQAATLTVIDNDDAGEGFNDASPVAPVGGNTGTTLGQQRLNALRFAADLLGSRLQSNVTIGIAAEFNPQQCRPNNATLASTGTTMLIANFRNAPRTDTFYPVALANALAGRDLDDGPDIGATFNSRIDSDPNCLGGVGWYYGLDDNPPGNALNFISTAVHELVHGLGFITFTNLSTGRFVDDTPDIYATFILDTQAGPWPALSPAERVTSARNDGNVVWDGVNNRREAASVTGGVNNNRLRLFAPDPVQPGSSISHWDTTVTPDALMEPFDMGDVIVTRNGVGLATCLLQDIGWTLNEGIRCPDGMPFSAANGTRPGAGEQAPPVPSDSSGASGSGGGGGGCALGTGAATDPLLPSLLLLGLAALYRRRKYDTGF